MTTFRAYKLSNRKKARRWYEKTARLRKALELVESLQKEGAELFLWSFEFYTPSEICVALEDAGYVWASNFQRWMKQEELGL